MVLFSPPVVFHRKRMKPIPIFALLFFCCVDICSQRVYKGAQTAQIAFPIGGMGSGFYSPGGTGSISLKCLMNRRCLQRSARRATRDKETARRARPGVWQGLLPVVSPPGFPLRLFG